MPSLHLLEKKNCTWRCFGLEPWQSFDHFQNHIPMMPWEMILYQKCISNPWNFRKSDSTLEKTSMAFHHGCPSSSLKNLQSFHLEIPEIPVTQHIQVSRFTIGIGEKYWKIILFSWSTPVLCPRYVHCSGSCGSKLQTLMEQPSMFQRTFFLKTNHI